VLDSGPVSKGSTKSRSDNDSTAKTKEIGPLVAAGDAPVGCIVYVSEAGHEDQGGSRRLETGSVVIGREEDCQLILNDASVSRRHARLTARPDGILVEDLGSTNGITYLGKRIERATLMPGARIGVGRYSIDLLPLSDSGSIPVSRRESYGSLVGTSLSMRRLYSLLEMLEHSEAPVLVEGETGTGKELVARALHENGRRARKPFVVIDCANVPAELMESELFGHRKGAFTGAVADRPGAFEEAGGGTVFLDELGELPLPLQPKLLRVLETGQVKRLGEARHLPVDVRIITATRRNLAVEVEQRRFRDDLFYRVAVVQLKLPPLRERREDIPLLVRHLSRQSPEGELDRLPPEAEELLMRHDWPGNVRELRNVVQRALALGIVSVESGELDHSARRAPGSGEKKYKQARELALREFERSYLQELWTRYRGNLSAAARAAGLDRKSLRNLLRRYNLY
jgi:DNA-binding NtrC family response regulator